MPFVIAGSTSNPKMPFVIAGSTSNPKMPFVIAGSTRNPIRASDVGFHAQKHQFTLFVRHRGDFTHKHI